MARDPQYPEDLGALTHHNISYFPAFASLKCM
jgi:hypothetical protein